MRHRNAAVAAVAVLVLIVAGTVLLRFQNTRSEPVRDRTGALQEAEFQADRFRDAVTALAARRAPDSGEVESVARRLPGLQVISNAAAGSGVNVVFRSAAAYGPQDKASGTAEVCYRLVLPPGQPPRATMTRTQCES
ncbi:hypothetical protein [Spirillospora sp. CA-294931]|uniref:hypothetical protein n=1 Tax=Spirillospora sp. CA-294931 TaxID=3240042 RepID=UPI003D91BD83